MAGARARAPASGLAWHSTTRSSTLPVLVVVLTVYTIQHTVLVCVMGFLLLSIGTDLPSRSGVQAGNFDRHTLSRIGYPGMHSGVMIGMLISITGLRLGSRERGLILSLYYR